MALFDEHINQAKSNLSFLSLTNQYNQSFWDWQVTIAFYVSVHLANAHLAKLADLHYRTHEDVKNALNPHNPTSLCKIDEPTYLAYAKLEGLSRRSRYLCHDDPKMFSKNAQFTTAKHTARAIRHLDKIIEYFKYLHKFELPKHKINCPELSKSEDIKNFKI